jgi:radical SAM protein with 4Fe4S-binding SPASM domain
MNVKILTEKAIFKLQNKLRKPLGIKPLRKTIVQIELSSICSASCEFCDWTRRPKELKMYLDTDLAKKAVKEAKELEAYMITFHVLGESLLHPDLFEILPKDWYIGLSTNCLQLTGKIADDLSNMENLNLILAVLWSEPEEKRKQSIANALAFLDKNPKCIEVSVQMICSENSIKYGKEMYDIFSPYFKRLPQLKLFYKQPYSQEPDYPILGGIPEGVTERRKVYIDRMQTPQSCGADCLAFAPNPITSILVRADGEINPCRYWNTDWRLGNIQNTTLKEAWDSDRRKEILKNWANGDPNKKQFCYECIHMHTPRGDPVWWTTTGIPPKVLDCNQIAKGGNDDPYPQPDE